MDKYWNFTKLNLRHQNQVWIMILLVKMNLVYINAIPLNGKEFEEWIPLITSQYAIDKYPKNAEMTKDSQIKLQCDMNFDPEKKESINQKVSLIHLDYFQKRIVVMIYQN